MERIIPDSIHDNKLLICKLEREEATGNPYLPTRRIVCPNSVRSTPGLARRLRDEQRALTGIAWTVVEA